MTAKELTDMGICPTCYDRSHDFCVYGDCSRQEIYKNEFFECFLASNPRADGHAVISSLKHYRDFMEAPESLVKEMCAFAQRAAIAIKEVYGAESVYLCTMCDGPMNHFHLQLIPRFGNEERGSKNFVKPRKEYVHDEEKVAKLRKRLGYKA